MVDDAVSLQVALAVRGAGANPRRRVGEVVDVEPKTIVEVDDDVVGPPRPLAHPST